MARRLMLYKKIHRQYLRQFRKGRKYRFCHGSNNVFGILRGPYITSKCLCCDSENFQLIPMIGPRKGKMIYNVSDLEWLED